MTIPPVEVVDDDEQLPAGPASAWWRRVLWAACAAVLALAVARAVTSGRGDAPARPVAQPAQPGPLDRVAALAAADALPDYTRETSPAGACPVVAVGDDLAARLLAAARRTVPAARLVDSGRILDQFTGLCAISLRVSGVGSTVVTVSVTAPGSAPAAGTRDRLTTGDRTRAGVTTRYALEQTADGWAVLVGAVGDPRLVPSATALGAAARDHALRW